MFGPAALPRLQLILSPGHPNQNPHSRLPRYSRPFICRPIGFIRLAGDFFGSQKIRRRLCWWMAVFLSPFSQLYLRLLLFLAPTPAWPPVLFALLFDPCQSASTTLSAVPCLPLRFSENRRSSFLTFAHKEPFGAQLLAWPLTVPTTLPAGPYPNHPGSLHHVRPSSPATVVGVVLLRLVRALLVRAFPTIIAGMTGCYFSCCKSGAHLATHFCATRFSGSPPELFPLAGCFGCTGVLPLSLLSTRALHGRYPPSRLPGPPCAFLSRARHPAASPRLLLLPASFKTLPLLPTSVPLRPGQKA